MKLYVIYTFMKKKRIYLYTSVIAILCIAWLFSDSNDENDAFSERVKIALRGAGNQLLIINQDSTSLILPIIALNKSKYKMSFQKHLSFEPNQLVIVVERAFQKSKLPEHYRVEVLQCSDHEVAYSYEISAKKENTIIPCAGRFLPKQCYTIEVKFTKRLASFFNKQTFLYLLLIIINLFLFDYFYSKRKDITTSSNIDNKLYNNIGSFQFYPEQNKLIKAAVEIDLSKKECELLSIFASRPNEIIKRDELTKKVWEDNGVFVGRSLDTYISKLRKKLNGDKTVKLTNIHGVGYKLEITHKHL